MADSCCRRINPFIYRFCVKSAILISPPARSRTDVLRGALEMPTGQGGCAYLVSWTRVNPRATALDGLPQDSALEFLWAAIPLSPQQCLILSLAGGRPPAPFIGWLMTRMALHQAARSTINPDRGDP